MSRPPEFAFVVSLVSLGVAGCGDDLPTIALTSDSGSTTSGLVTGVADSSTGGEPACGPQSASTLALCAESDRIADDVRFVADIRDPGTMHWLAVQELCADRLSMLGFTVELHEYATGINVIGRRPGTTTPEQLVLVGAHYDHIPECLGADDNATGVAGALEVARVLGPVPTERTLAVACWDEEERGFFGSFAWVNEGIAPDESVVAYYNYDMIGFATEEPQTQAIPFGFDTIFPEQFGMVRDNEFRGDFILLAADDLALAPAEAFQVHAQTLGLPTIAVILDGSSKNSDLFSDLRRSDHSPFWMADIPAMFLTDSANFRNPAYHCAEGQDSVDMLDFEFAAAVVGSTLGSAAELLRMP